MLGKEEMLGFPCLLLSCVCTCVCTRELVCVCVYTHVMPHAGTSDTFQAYHPHWRNPGLVSCRPARVISISRKTPHAWLIDLNGKASLWEFPRACLKRAINSPNNKGRKNNNSPSWCPGCKWLIYSGKRNGVLMTNCNAAQQAWLCAVNYFEGGTMP